MLSSLSRCRTPHTESQPKCLSNGHPFCQLPWTIRFYFLSNILPLLSPQYNNFWHFQAIPCQGFAHQTHYTSFPFVDGALGTRGLLVRWVPAHWETHYNHQPQRSCWKCFTTEGGGSNRESNFHICIVILGS